MLEITNHHIFKSFFSSKLLILSSVSTEAMGLEFYQRSQSIIQPLLSSSSGVLASSTACTSFVIRGLISSGNSFL